MCAKHIVNYKKLIDKINIKSGDIILINSNFLYIFLKLKEKKKIFSFDRFINELHFKIGNKGTILIPAYSWEFCKKKEFDYNKTKSICGSLPNYFIGKETFQRTQNPIYSFLVKGFYQKYLCSLKNKDSFGNNSIFEFLKKKKAKNLFLDIDYKKSFTFVHLAEQKAKINYRFKKTFSGYFLKEKKKKKISSIVFSRKLETGVIGTKIDDLFDTILIKNKALNKKKIMGIDCQIVDISKACNIMNKYFINGKNKYIYPIYKKN